MNINDSNITNRNISPFINDEYDLIKLANFNQENSRSRCTIASIVNINSKSVDIQPLINYYDKVDGFKTPQILKDIPVAQIKSSNFSLKMPLNIGDVGIVIWCDREVFSWLDSETVGSRDPDSGTFHNESACIFIPFLSKFMQVDVIKNAGVDIKSGEVSLLTELIKVTQNFNETITELLGLLSAMMMFNNTLISLSGSGSISTYSSTVATSATTENTTINDIVTHLSQISSDITGITNQFITFKGEQE